MDYSPLITQSDHPLLFESTELDDLFEDIRKQKEQSLEFENNSSSRRTSSPIPSNNAKFKRDNARDIIWNREEKMTDLQETSPVKKSSPIAIKVASSEHSKIQGQQQHNSGGSSTGGSSSGYRMSFLRAFTKKRKDKRVPEKTIAMEPVVDGVTFSVKFLGSTLIEKTGAADAAEAIKTVIQMAKAGQKPCRIGLNISSDGVTLSEQSTGEIRMAISIYDIAHCSADAHHPNVFSFIATNKNDVNECYCFATRKRKQAQHITLTIAQAFNVAFEMWQNSSMENNGVGSSVSDNEILPVVVGSSGSVGSSGCGIREWVAFDQDDEQDDQDISQVINGIKMVTLSPFSMPNAHPSRRAKARATQPSNDLLICLT